MTAEAVIAVRGGEGAKSRLGDLFAGSDREALTAAMLEDMLAVLAAAPGIERTHVVTPTPDLARLATRLGASAEVEIGSPDLNRAFQLVRRRIAGTSPETTLLLLPGDLPLIAVEDVDSALATAGRGVVGLAAAGQGGTGAIVQAAGAELALAFGPDSFRRHREAAEAAGLEVREIEAPGLAFDLDRPEEVETVLDLAPGGRTGTLLRRLKRGAA